MNDKTESKVAAATPLILFTKLALIIMMITAGSSLLAQSSFGTIPLWHNFSCESNQSGISCGKRTPPSCESFRTI